MLPTRLYYQVRPMIPRRLQILLRSWVVRSKYARYRDTWPISHETASPPENWKGWPDGKRFAFVLTHDVETEAGQRRCPDLMEIERELGFVSSYNFVPERYPVSSETRESLARSGFEVGVHDLKHDGKLYDSHRKFLECAGKINGYLKDWGAVGFRSGAMHHNLDWIHALDIEYDASTFEFDPFEPQPDGMNTIFPLWVRRDGSERGYVELPYTLPQDFTLFKLLGEKDISIWKKKLDWVASKGGMALLIAHPDYMSFDGNAPRFDQYPVRLYQDLLEHVRSRYDGQYWNATPRDVARFYKKIAARD